MNEASADAVGTCRTGRPALPHVPTVGRPPWGWKLGTVPPRMGVAAAVAVLVGGLMVAAAGPVAAATPTTYTVTSIGDDGDAGTQANCAAGTSPCTLRAALLEANAHPNDPSGVDEIRFSIPGPPPHVIAAATDLPLITDPVTVDAGLPAPGTPRTVEVTGRSCVSGTGHACDGLVTRVGSTTVRGLAVNGFYHGFRALAPGSVPITGMVVEGNFFGTDATGTQLVGPPDGTADDGRGVLLSGVDTSRIGGDPAAGAGNLIVGSRVIAVDLGVSSGIQVLGNLIGVGLDGATPMATPATSGGISLNTGSGNVFGAPGAGNVISGLSGPGIVARAATGLRIQANRIGTDASGSIAVPNRGGYGIDVDGTDTTIGGSPAAGNVVSANGGGINLGGSGGEVSHNRIGTDLAGTTALGNDLGIRVASFGSDYYIHHNVISGNGATAANGVGPGVAFDTFATGNRLEANQIGVGADGRALGNGGAGVMARYDEFFGGSGSIGAVGAGNEIAYNGRAGIIVTGAAGAEPHRGVTIRGNSIHDNGGVPGATGLGIDLVSNTDSGEGPDGIDPLDADDGTNQRQNAPEILDVVTDATSAQITVRLRSVPGQDFTVDVYANPACDASGYGEGQTSLGTKVVTTAPAGDPQAGTAQFTLQVPHPVTAQGIAATATNSFGSTSEFSACLRATRTGTVTTYTGPGTATYSDPLTMSGRLTDGDTQPGAAIPGARLEFTLGDQSPVPASPTDQDGNVTAAPTVVSLPPGTVDVVTRFAGDDTHLASSDRDPVIIAQEDSELSYVGDTLVPALSSTRLGAQFGESDAYPGDWSGKEITFAVTSASGATTEYAATTSAAGLAEVRVPLNADVYAVRPRFDGDEFYHHAKPLPDTLVTVSAAAAKVTGGGWISNTIGRTSFGFNAIPQTDGTFKGQFQLRANSDKSKFHGTDVTTLTVVSPTSVSWTGTGHWNGTAGYTFQATVVDNGSSGSKKGDTISIKIYKTGDPTHPVFTTSGPQPLKGGNITVH